MVVERRGPLVGVCSLFVAALGLVALAIPGAGKYAAIGLGMFAIAAGVLAWRRRGEAPRGRLTGAAGVAVGTVALALGGAQTALTLVALDRFAHLFAP